MVSTASTPGRCAGRCANARNAGGRGLAPTDAVVAKFCEGIEVPCTAVVWIGLHAFFFWGGRRDGFQFVGYGTRWNGRP